MMNELNRDALIDSESPNPSFGALHRICFRKICLTMVMLVATTYQEASFD